MLQIEQEYFHILFLRCDNTSLAFQHAIGNLNVKTKCIVDNFDPNKWNVCKYFLITSKEFSFI
jgi:hypothetical protein